MSIPFNGTFRQVADFLHTAKRINPEHGVGFVNPDKSILFYTYPELELLSRRLLKGMQMKGLGKGDIVILSLDSCSEIVPVLWACFMGGIVPALLQPPVSFSEYNPAAEKAEKVYRQLGHPYVILSHQHLNAWYASGIPTDSLIDVANISSEDPDAEIPDIQSDDLALIQFSSGSTGDPKGVTLTHRNILHNVAAIAEGFDHRPGDNWVSWMPLYHDMGLIGFHITPITTGDSALYINPLDFVKNPGLYLDLMSGKPSLITGCPNFGQLILNRYFTRKKNPDWDFSGIRAIFNGAEPISVPTMDEFMKNMSVFGFDPVAMLPCYGMAEATLAITFFPHDQSPVITSFNRSLLLGKGIAERAPTNNESIQLVSLGKCIRYCEVKVTDDKGNKIPDAHTGHVHVRGDNVTKGYYNNPAATSAILIDGWLHTGDLGFIYEGDLYIMGRLKDVIFINGINYYAHDLETIALQVEGVASGRFVMAGYFDEKEGKDKVIVFLVASDNQSSRDLFRSLHQHFLKSIGLKINIFIPIKSNEIPRTSSGKIQRYKMVNRFLTGDYPTVIIL